jgi:hypothetical protein
VASADDKRRTKRLPTVGTASEGADMLEDEIESIWGVQPMSAGWKLM